MLLHWLGTFHLQGWVSFNYKSTSISCIVLSTTTKQKERIPYV